jgi:murein L,D-transpeptidase YafK
MDRRHFLTAGAAALTLGLAGCGTQDPRMMRYNGPKVTSLVVFKARRSLQLFNDNTLLKSYAIDLGFAPEGHKQFEGDGKTPEGDYWISHRNPNSAYHLSIKVSYPNDNDRAFARARGRSPGGDIFIHGTPNRYRRARDWTAGCVAIDNHEMEEVYAMVEPGTMIFLRS